jgi:hypothetical protein
VKLFSRRHWRLSASIATLSTLVLAFIAFSNKPKVLSMGDALSIAQKRIDVNEARRNPEKKKWVTPILTSHKFDSYDGAWHFDFASVGCEYWIAVDADGSTDMTGIRGCEIGELGAAQFK